MWELVEGPPALLAVIRPLLQIRAVPLEEFRLRGGVVVGSAEGAYWLQGDLNIPAAIVAFALVNRSVFYLAVNLAGSLASSRFLEALP